MNGKFRYEYDLSEGWQSLTGLPFVFAVWASRKKLSPETEATFTTALRHGLANIDDVVKYNAPHYPGVDVNGYLTRSISYNLDLEKRKAIELFLMKIA
jgi:chorismate dehydratase